MCVAQRCERVDNCGDRVVIGRGADNVDIANQFGAAPDASRHIDMFDVRATLAKFNHHAVSRLCRPTKPDSTSLVYPHSGVAQDRRSNFFSDPGKRLEDFGLYRSGQLLERTNAEFFRRYHRSLWPDTRNLHKQEHAVRDFLLKPLQQTQPARPDQFLRFFDNRLPKTRNLPQASGIFDNVTDRKRQAFYRVGSFRVSANLEHVLARRLH